MRLCHWLTIAPGFRWACLLAAVTACATSGPAKDLAPGAADCETAAVAPTAEKKSDDKLEAARRTYEDETRQECAAAEDRRRAGAKEGGIDYAEPWELHSIDHVMLDYHCPRCDWVSHTRTATLTGRHVGACAHLMCADPKDCTRRAFELSEAAREWTLKPMECAVDHLVGRYERRHHPSDTQWRQLRSRLMKVAQDVSKSAPVEQQASRNGHRLAAVAFLSFDEIKRRALESKDLPEHAAELIRGWAEPADCEEFDSEELEDEKPAPKPAPAPARRKQRSR